MLLNVRSALLNHGYKVTTVVDGVGLLVGGWRILDRADALCRRFRSALARIGTLEFFTAVLFGQRSEGLPGDLLDSRTRRPAKLNSYHKMLERTKPPVLGSLYLGR